MKRYNNNYTLFLSSLSVPKVQSIKLAFQQTLPSIWKIYDRLSVSVNNDT
ncbi:hypothetical protein [Candidatus Vesicomyidisocius sp. SY067_SCS001]|nr:hypothetical protein [Candidatus Vesicomyosocius sp. SY067_SCS001]